MNRQEVFGRSITAIVAQGHPAIAKKPGGDGCVYRAPNGDKCAIGHLIPDDVYQPAMDSNPKGTNITAVLRDFPAVSNALGVNSDDDGYFLHSLQSLHDNSASELSDWGTQLLTRTKSFAKKYKLTYPEWLDRIEWDSVNKVFIEVRPMANIVDQQLADLHTLFSDKSKWGKGHYTIKADGTPAYSGDTVAAYCVIGGLGKVMGISPIYVELDRGPGNRLSLAARELFNVGPINTNDNIGYEAVMATIARARQAGVV